MRYNIDGHGAHWNPGVICIEARYLYSYTVMSERNVFLQEVS